MTQKQTDIHTILACQLFMLDKGEKFDLTTILEALFQRLCFVVDIVRFSLFNVLGQQGMWVGL